MILGSMDMDMVHMEVVVLGSNWIGIGVNEDHMMVNGKKELVSVVVRSYVERMVYKHRVGLVGNYKGSIISISLVCIVEWSSSMISWKVLLPKGLIRSSWLHPSLIALTLMHVPAIAFVPFNNIRTKLKARGVRVHGSK